MTIHIIDPSKPLPPTYENSKHALSLEDGDVAIVMSGAKVEAYGWWAHGIYGSTGSSITVDGSIYSQFASGVWVRGGNVTVGASGTIQGRDGAVWFRGFDGHTNVLTNAGQLIGPDEGFAAVVVEGGTNIINNSGVIGGGFGGIQTNAFVIMEHEELIVINNTGTIKGTEWAISGSYYGRHVITNKGLIDGAILLGHGDDFYDGRGGTATGEIFLAEGNDTAYGGDGSETFFAWVGDDFIDGGAGIDTLLLSWNDSLGTGAAHTVDLRVTEKQTVGTSSTMIIRNMENLVGGNVRDVFIGSTAANTLIGNGGNDTLDGYDGNDLLSGGMGDDLLVGGSGSDTAVFTGKFSDYTITVSAGSITIADTRASSDGIDVLGGVEFALFSDRIYTLSYSGSSPAEAPPTPTSPATPTTAPLSTPEASLKLVGTKRADTFIGGTGDDYLNGAAGRDILTGGEGKDVFVFSTKLKANVDTITDFQDGQDMIQLSKAVFSKIGKGALKKSAFHIGTKAKDAHDRIIFNAKTGAVSYDADGNGKKFAAVKFAQLETKALPSADDFWVL